FQRPLLHAGHPACQHAGERRNSSDEEPLGTAASRAAPGGRGPQKLGASLKRRDRIRSNSISDTLPAKFIRTTSVKPQTLNPKWERAVQAVRLSLFC
ncbi:c2 domain-containing protein, partial [Caerostris extrusa]